ncbi:MAG TPA: radical SAM protein [Tepidisphaeraceae bacterium]|jgi:putative pyruvate formate lyase activating enzyme
MSDSLIQPQRLAAARCHDRACMLCEHRCGAARDSGERGPCKAGTEARVFRHRVEYGEEAELVPSHLFYLSGCDLRCVFCIAGLDAFDPSRGGVLTSEWFNACVEWGRGQGARNIQWVGGEPTIHLPRVLEVMALCPKLPPVVWKSDFYGTPEAFDLLEGVVDVYVADLKFGNEACAKRLSGVDGYMPIVCRNLLRVAQQPAARLIVRHLLLPGHEECCYRPILHWLRAHLPQVPLSLRDSYMPSWRAKRFDELSAPLSPRAGSAARGLAAAFNLTVIQ